MKEFTMTIKEIAELCGVYKTTVQRWILNDKFLRCNLHLRNKIKEKLENGSPEKPSDYDLEETLAIIGDGGKNKTLAALLAENAQNKDAITAQNDVSAHLNLIENRLDRIENAINSLAEALKQALIRPAPSRKAIGHKHYGKAPLKTERYEQAFNEYIAQCIEAKGPQWYERCSALWQQYKETVKKEDRLKKHEFFERLAVAFPETRIDTGKYNQVLCYGIKIKM